MGGSFDDVWRGKRSLEVIKERYGGREEPSKQRKKYPFYIHTSFLSKVCKVGVVDGHTDGR